MELTLDGVRREYGETAALAGIDLTVEDGEFFTLVGPSGCGKTTTLRLVAGFEPPSAGEIRFDGEAMSGVPPESRGVGVVFQSYALFPHLSVAENVAYGLRFTDPPEGVDRDERVASLLELVDLPEMGDRDPTELSGGQQQRVALARALAPGPDLLLLDEPMSALDARLRERLRLQVKEIQSELGITTLYVTHDQEEALAISDRVAVMNDGEIEQIGRPRAVYRRPETRFAAEFVGDNNVFEGRVTGRRATGGDEVESPVETEGLAGSTIDLGGRTVAVGGDRSLSPGRRVAFCVRPEQMRLLGDGAAAKETNVLEGTVTKTEFLGDATRTYLRWDGRELTVQSTDWSDGGTDQVDGGTDRDDGGATAEIGDDVRVGFSPAAAHVFEVRDGE
ncbi:MAG: ABC transporter ATP-binding protein [Haloquadratum sp.]